MDHNINDDYSEEEDTDDNEDTTDEPEVDLGPGVKRIRDDTDIDDMLDDTISLSFKLVDDIGKHPHAENL